MDKLKCLVLVLWWLVQIDQFQSVSSYNSTQHISSCQFSITNDLLLTCSEQDHSGISEHIQSHRYVMCGSTRKDLSEIYFIFFTDCNFTAYPYDLLRRFSSVVGIYLASNEITSINRSISTNSKLEYLDFTNNDIDNISGNIFIGLSVLTNLDLSGNHIKNVSGDMFNGLSSLRILNLNSNFIKHIPSNTFALLRNLVRLELAHNQIDRIDASIFNEGNHLEWMDLSWNPITKLDRNAFLHLNHLTYLDLCHSQLANISIETFAPLNVIETLDLSFNELTELPMHSFSNLKHFRIAHNRFPCSYLEPLLQSSRFSALNVDVNRGKIIEPDCIRIDTLPVSQNTTHEPDPSDVASSISAAKYADMEYRSQPNALKNDSNNQSINQKDIVGKVMANHAYKETRQTALLLIFFFVVIVVFSVTVFIHYLRQYMSKKRAELPLCLNDSLDTFS